MERWLLNLQSRALEVRRDPGRIPGAESGYGYKTMILVTEQETVAPLASPESTIRVADMLPVQPRRRAGRR